MPEKLSATLEDYLETIYFLQWRKGFARVRDIAEALQVADSTATAAHHSLDPKGLINYGPYEPVTLSAVGRERSEEIVLRHRIIEDFLGSVLDLSPGRAESIACEMEHCIDREARERFLCFLAFTKQHSPWGIDRLEQFRRFLREGADGQTCRECVAGYMEHLQQTSPEGAERFRPEQ